MSILETVRRICQEEAAKFLPGATVVAPLAVWDSDNKFMGVQIKAPRRMGAQDCEVTAGFVLSPAELKTQELIRVKANAAVACMTRDIQVSIRSVKAMRAALPETGLSETEAEVAPGMIEAGTAALWEFETTVSSKRLVFEVYSAMIRAAFPMTDAQAEDITRRSA